MLPISKQNISRHSLIALIAISIFFATFSFFFFYEYFYFSAGLTLYFSAFFLLFRNQNTYLDIDGAIVYTALYLPLCNSFVTKLVRGPVSQSFGWNWGLVVTIDLLIALYFLYRFRQNLKFSLRQFFSKNRIAGVLFFLIFISICISTFNTEYREIVLPRDANLLLLIFFSVGAYFISFKQRALGSSLFAFGCSLLFIMTVSILWVFWHKGFPLTAMDFLKVKMDVPFMNELGIFTYGNSGHLAAVALFTNALFIPLYYSSLNSVASRFIYSILSIASLLVILILYSRTALIAYIFLNLFYLIFLFLRFRIRPILVSICLIYVLVILSLDSSISRYMTPFIKGPVSIFGVQFFQFADSQKPDNAYVDRFAAMERGIDLIRQEGILGKGLGVYRIYDPEFTSPHNYALLATFELGILGSLSIYALLVFCMTVFLKETVNDGSLSKEQMLLLSSFGVLFQFIFISVISGIGLFFDSVLIHGYFVFGVIGLGLGILKRKNYR